MWIAGATLLGIVVVLLVRARGPLVQVVLPVRRDLEQHIVSSGRVRVPTRVEVSAELSGKVTVVGAVESQRVKVGDLLVQLDDAVERSEIAKAEATVAQANARVGQLREVGATVASESLRQAEANLEKAQSELARTTQLVAKGAVAGVELENARRAVAIARAQHTAAKAEQLATGRMGADTRVALTALLRAEADLEGALVRLAKTRLTAHQNGTILTRSVEPGDVVQPGRVLMVLAADADVELVFQPAERDLAWLALGQSAKAAADAYPQDVFDARVSYIAPSIDPLRGSIEVRLAVPRPPPFLRPEMTVSIDLTVKAQADALTLPSEVVRDAATSAPWVLVVERGRVARRAVQLGIRGDGAVEIRGGVDESSRVVVPDGRVFAPGSRVRTEDG